ncbi:uncharacterized protein LOC128283868 [Gossypium arboreum]|uniref:uncharacterized protein LOC128283868 n=1 Tax=Gossypium arboreum TaxID=29729 RepID=UPI0022F184A2|nr:uncharacterized protein LOC128283868 [Gossypium arboreum]
MKHDRICDCIDIQVPSRQYAVKAKEDCDAADMITGIFTLFSIPITALVDSGSTHSYICSEIIREKGILVEELDVRIQVSNPLGLDVLVDKVYRRCLVEIQGQLFSANLMELPYREFDVILGIDWLTEHDASLRCRMR